MFHNECSLVVVQSRSRGRHSQLQLSFLFPSSPPLLCRAPSPLEKKGGKEKSARKHATTKQKEEKHASRAVASLLLSFFHSFSPLFSTWEDEVAHRELGEGKERERERTDAIDAGAKEMKNKGIKSEKTFGCVELPRGKYHEQFADQRRPKSLTFRTFSFSSIYCALFFYFFPLPLPPIILPSPGLPQYQRFFKTGTVRRPAIGSNSLSCSPPSPQCGRAKEKKRKKKTVRELWQRGEI